MRNVFSSTSIFVLNTIIVFIAYPIFIGFLGSEMYGLWLTISVIITMGEFGNLGISKAIIRFVSEEYNSLSFRNINIYFSSAILFLTFISTCIILIIFTFLEPISNFFLGVFEIESPKLLILGMGLLSYFTLVFSLFNGILTGLGRLDLSFVIFFIRNLLKFVISLLIFHTLFVSVWALFWGVLISNLIGILLYYLIIRFKYKISVTIIGNFRIEFLKRLLNFGSYIFGAQIANMALIPVIKLVIAKTIGYTSVTLFELFYNSSFAVRNLFEKGLLALLPKASGVKDPLKIKQTHNKSISFIVIVALPIMVLIFLFSMDLLQFWLGDKYDPIINSGFRLMILSWCFSLLFVPSYYIFMAIDKQKICFFESTIKSILSLLILIALMFTGNLTLINIAIGLSVSIIISHSFLGYNYYEIFYGKS